MKNKKTLIIEKSLILFKNNSFFAISTQDLAKRLNIQKSLLFYYFKNKTNLYYEVINNYFENLKNKFAIIFKKNLSAEKRLQLLSELYLHELDNSELTDLINIVNKNSKQPITDLVYQIQEEIINFFSLVVEEGIRKGEFRKANAYNMSLALIGYLDKNKQYNIKLKKNWFEFLLK